MQATGICFSFFNRFWPNNNSRMYVLEGTGTFLISVLTSKVYLVNICKFLIVFSGEFAEEHELQIGDYIMLYRDSVNLNYVSMLSLAH